MRQEQEPVRAGQDVQWRRCGACGAFVYGKRLDRNLKVCPECQFHFRISPDTRIRQLADPDSFRPLPADYEPRDLLAFSDSKPYPDRLRDARARTGRNDALVAGELTIEGHGLVVAAVDFGFMGGSMGAVVGEAIAAAARHALARRLPLLLIAASGGARMQEGAVSLMQMAKTGQAVAALREAGVLGRLPDHRPDLRRRQRLLRHARRRHHRRAGRPHRLRRPAVIQQTIREELPDGFQTAEFLLEHGLIDLVVPRENLRERLARLLSPVRPVRRPDAPDTARRQPNRSPSPLPALPPRDP